MRELNEDEVLEAFYNGIKPSKLYAPNVEYNVQAQKLGLEMIPAQPAFTEEWLMPEKYRDMDLEQYFSQMKLSDIQRRRVSEEITLFIQTGADNLLRYLIYLSQIIRDNNIVTGVGRGSSVSLYTLYLIGIHKVDSMKYELSPREFFKNEEIE